MIHFTVFVNKVDLCLQTKGLHGVILFKALSSAIIPKRSNLTETCTDNNNNNNTNNTTTNNNNNKLYFYSV